MLGKLNINNPGNIRQSNDLFMGEIKPSSDSAFKEFASMAFGYRAMFKILDTYRKKGLLNIKQIVARYSEDNVDAYIKFVSQRTGYNSGTPIPEDRLSQSRLVAAMSHFENGVDANMYEVEKGWNLKENIETTAKVAGGFGLLALGGLLILFLKNINTN